MPTDALARASALVSARRGQILGFEAREGWAGWEALRALIPEAEIGDLIVELRSATSGVGAFETKFDHLAELSGRGGRSGGRRASEGERVNFVERRARFPAVQTRGLRLNGAARLWRGRR